MTVQEIKDLAEEFIEDLKPSILPLQIQWKISNPTYWQGIRTPQQTPENGAEGSLDSTLSRPPMPSWFVFGLSLPDRAPFSVGCDQTVRHDCLTVCEKESFALWCRFVFSENTYSKRADWCEEDGWVDHPWNVQEPPE